MVSSNDVIHSVQDRVFERIRIQETDRSKLPQQVVCNNEQEPESLLLWPIVCDSVPWYIHTYIISWMNIVIYPRSEDVVVSDKNLYLLSSWDYRNFIVKNNTITLTDSQFPIVIDKVSKNGSSVVDVISTAKNMVLSGYVLWEVSTWTNSKILSWTYNIYNFSYRKSSAIWDEIISKSYVFSLGFNTTYYYIYTDSSINEGSKRRTSMYPIELFIK